MPRVTWSRRHRGDVFISIEEGNLRRDSPELEGEVVDNPSAGGLLLRPQTLCPAASSLPDSGEPGDIAGSTKMSLAPRRGRSGPGSCATAPQSECDVVIALGGPRLVSPGQGEPGPEAFIPGALSVVSTVSIRDMAGLPSLEMSVPS